MKTLLVFLMILFPSKHIDHISIEFISEQPSIFHNYANDNFLQTVTLQSGNIVKLSIKNFGYIDIDLNFRISLDKDYVKKLSNEERKTVEALFHNTISLKSYLQNISWYVKDNISYKENSIFKRPEEVLIHKEANCIGYSALVREMLNSIGINSKYVKGFFLKKKDEKDFIPVPHRWLEISLPSGESFFYDPQYQGFTANYIVMDGNISFTEIKKFLIHLIERKKKFIN